MTALLTVVTALGITLMGLGSFVQHNRRPGARHIGLATEGVGFAATGLGWLVSGLQGQVDCYAPDSGCPTSLLGFGWLVVRAPVLESMWLGAAYLVGWALAVVSPWRGTQTYPASDLERIVEGMGGLRQDRQVGHARPQPVTLPRPVSEEPRPAVPVPGWEVVSVNGTISHLRRPDGRSACGRMMPEYPAATDVARLCRLCAQRSGAHSDPVPGD